MTLNCNITNAQENEAMMQLLPRGRAWYSAVYNDSNIYNFYLSISSAIVDFKRDACDLIEEFFCSTQTQLNDEWLREYALPNACDPRGETLCLLANGLDANLGFEQVLEDALERLGVTATVVNESPNGVPLTISIVLSSSSNILQDCFYYAGNNNFSQSVTVDGVPISDLGNNATDPTTPSDPDGMFAVDPTTYVAATTSCGFVAANPTIECPNALKAGVPLTSVIPNLTCIFEDIVPLGIKINYYLGDKTNPILGD